MPTPTLSQPAFRINTSTLGGQQSAAVAGLSDGRFVAVWEDVNGSFGILKYAIYNADGSVAKSEAIANVDTTGSIARGDVAIAAVTGGGFAITWAARLNLQWDVFHRVFDGSGNPVTGDVLTNQGASLQNQRHPDIVGDGAGGFYVVWEDTESNAGVPVRPNVQLRHFDAAGLATAGATGLSDAIGGDEVPQIAVSRDGSKVAVVWDDDLGQTQGGNEDSIRGFVSGVGAFRVDHGPFHEFNTAPDVAYSTGDNFMVVWSKFISSGVYEVAGAINGGIEFKINTTGHNDNMMPHVVGLQSGDFLVVWNDANFSGTGFHVLGQLLGVDGTPIGSEFTVTDFAANDIERIEASELMDGRVLVTWDPNKGPQTVGTDAFARIVDPRQGASNWVGTAADEQYVGTSFADVLDGAARQRPLVGRGRSRPDDRRSGQRHFLCRQCRRQDARGGRARQRHGADHRFLCARGGAGDRNLRHGLSGRNAAINLTGNELAQRIDGNNGVNVINGSGGNDLLVGYGGNDIMIGGAGSDTLVGGLGNDIYVLENGADTVVDSGGVDTITSTVSRSLAGYTTVERLTLVNVATALAGTGNNLANTIVGNNFANTLSGGLGADILSGGIGNDKLVGGAGIDTLTGGLNNDIFVFNAPLSALNRDIVTDFNHIADTFQLENAVMAKLGAGVHALSATMFRAGAAAADANDYIVYNQANGNLFYDSTAMAPAALPCSPCSPIGRCWRPTTSS